MKDKLDNATLDAFSFPKRRGRPRKASIAVKRTQSAARSKKYREKQRIISDCASQLASYPELHRDVYLSFMNYVCNDDNDKKCLVIFRNTSEHEEMREMLFSELAVCYFEFTGLRLVPYSGL